MPTCLLSFLFSRVTSQQRYSITIPPVETQLLRPFTPTGHTIVQPVHAAPEAEGRLNHQQNSRSVSVRARDRRAFCLVLHPDEPRNPAPVSPPHSIGSILLPTQQIYYSSSTPYIIQPLFIRPCLPRRGIYPSTYRCSRYVTTISCSSDATAVSAFVWYDTLSLTRAVKPRPIHVHVEQVE